MSHEVSITVVLAAMLCPWPATAGDRPSLVGPDPWKPFRLEAEQRERHASLVIEDAYRAVLAAWAAGSHGEALTALVDLEARFPDESGASCYAKVRGNTLEELARNDPETLVPVLALRVALWEAGVDHDAFARAQSKRKEIVDLVDFYVRQGSPEAPAVTGRFLVHWGHRMVSFGYLIFLEDSVEIFDLALGYEPANEVALEENAVIRERLGQYKRVLPLLERLLEVRPDHCAARLRLAVNQSRTGFGEAAVRALTALARSDAESWIRILAYEELIRLRSAEGEAIEIAREARGHFPESERLAIQLAYLEPSSGAAEQVLAQWHGDTGSTPRLVYEQGPVELLRQQREQLQEDVGRRQAILETTLHRITADDSARPRFKACAGMSNRLK